MKPFSIFFVLAFLLISTPIFSTVIPLDAPIEQVIVYRNGATVQRKINTTFEKGEQTLYLKNISSHIRSSTLRAMLPAHIQLLDISVRNRYEWEKDNVSDEVAAWQKRVEEIEEEINILKEEKSLLQQNKLIKGNENLTPQQMAAFLDFYTDRLKKISKKNQTLNSEKRMLSEKMKRYQMEHRSSSSGQKIIELKVWAHETESADILVQYLVNAASWATTYDLKMNSLEDPLQLDYKGKVLNNTGVDWTDVDLRLSTGNPYMSINRPPLMPWVLDEQPYYAKRKLSSFNGETKSAPYANIREEMDNANIKDLGKIETRENITAMEFKLTDAHDILADGQYHEVMLKSHQMNAEYAYEVVPKVSPYAYLMANIPQWTKYQLSQGKIRVFIENAYQGELYFNPAQHADTLQLSLGIDIGVHVKREQIDGLTESRWFGSKKEKKVTWKITVSNHKSAPIDITIFDQIPISRNGDIVVQEMKYKGAELDKETGELTWKEHISSGEKIENTFTYEVKYPKHYNLGML